MSIPILKEFSTKKKKNMGCQVRIDVIMLVSVCRNYFLTLSAKRGILELYLHENYCDVDLAIDLFLYVLFMQSLWKVLGDDPS